PAQQQHPGYRYGYAQELFFGGDNDPERLAFLGRLPAILCVGLLVLTVFSFLWRYYGSGAAAAGALAAALLPDVLAHGGVAYSDVPVALMILASLWAWHEAARRETLTTAGIAGALTAIAVGIKFSAVALIPAAGLIG